jgi:uridine kinase
MYKSFVGIAGGTGSGKTGICDEIAQGLGDQVCIISQDWFYKELPEGTNGDTYNWDDPKSIDVEEILEILKELFAGREVYAPDHDFATYQKKYNVHHLKPAPIIILEGIYALYFPPIRDLMNYKIFVQCPSDIALVRRAFRDAKERGYTYETTLERYQICVGPAFKDHIEPTQKYANVIIPNITNLGIKNNEGVEILINSLRYRLLKI